MRSFILTLVAASALSLGGAFNSTADAQYRGYRSYSSAPRYYNSYRGNYYRGYAPRAYYGAYPYRRYPYYSSYRYAQPYYGRYYYNRPYYGGYYSSGVGISVGPFRGGVRF